MSERRFDEQRSPDEFAPILASAEQPLVVGGQAVNIWAELYTPVIPALTELAPEGSVRQRQSLLFAANTLKSCHE